MFKSFLNIILVGVLVIFVLGSLAFSAGKLAKVNCDELVVKIAEDSPRFLDEEEIERLVKKADEKLFEKQLNKINTEALEAELKKETAIKNVEIYRRVTGETMEFKGRLLVEVEQRSPVLRVINGKEDFYLDNEGVRIPSSQVFTAKVLLVSGHADEKLAREQLLPMINFMDEDEFWKAQIEQIQVNKNGELFMAPLVGDQLIEFGAPSDYLIKFRNLKALYEQALPKVGWEYYSKINLKYTNQVVCTKK